jgi:hypothetical protein
MGVFMGFSASAVSLVGWQVCIPFFIGGTLHMILTDTIYAF